MSELPDEDDEGCPDRRQRGRRRTREPGHHLLLARDGQQVVSAPLLGHLPGRPAPLLHRQFFVLALDLTVTHHEPVGVDHGLILAQASLLGLRSDLEVVDLAAVRLAADLDQLCLDLAWS